MGNIERDIQINGKQPVIYEGEVAEVFDYYVNKYGRFNIHYICSLVYNLGMIHGKRRERARRKAGAMKA